MFPSKTLAYVVLWGLFFCLFWPFAAETPSLISFVFLFLSKTFLRMKYIWTGHMCAVAAYGVCGTELWTLVLRALRCNTKVLVRCYCCFSVCLFYLRIKKLNTDNLLYSSIWVVFFIDQSPLTVLLIISVRFNSFACKCNSVNNVAQSLMNIQIKT